MVDVKPVVALLLLAFAALMIYLSNEDGRFQASIRIVKTVPITFVTAGDDVGVATVSPVPPPSPSVLPRKEGSEENRMTEPPNVNVSTKSTLGPAVATTTAIPTSILVKDEKSGKSSNSSSVKSDATEASSERPGGKMAAVAMSGNTSSAAPTTPTPISGRSSSSPVSTTGMMMGTTTAAPTRTATTTQPVTTKESAIAANETPVVAPKIWSTKKPSSLGSSCTIKSLAAAASYSNTEHRWKYNKWCWELPLSRDALLARLQGKKIVFVGDSVARNSFVLTMARLCNAKNLRKCIYRMPTYEYDIDAVPENRGPMGCVPPDATNDQTAKQLSEAKPNTKGVVDSNDSSTSAGRSDNTSSGSGNASTTVMTRSSPCYKEGKFWDQYLRGLTTKSVPQDRQHRRIFIRKGLIGPAMHMEYQNVTLVYLGITKPQQLQKVGKWMAGHINGYLHGDAMVVSIGPHLKFQEIEYVNRTLVEGLTAVRSAYKNPIVLAEFVHAYGTKTDFHTYIDNLMNELQKLIAPLDIPIVPQRYVTQDNYLLPNVNMSELDRTQPSGKCGYYDPQHPGLDCQLVTSELLLSAAFLEIDRYKQP